MSSRKRQKHPPLVSVSSLVKCENCAKIQAELPQNENRKTNQSGKQMKTIQLTALVAGLSLLTFNSKAQPASFLTNGLVAYYPFNGNAIDASGNGNNGTNYGATLITDRFGKTNAAYSFNGSNWIDIGPVVSRYDTMSLTAWINTTSLSSFQDEAAIVSKPNDTTTLTGSRLGTYKGAFDSGFASD